MTLAIDAELMTDYQTTVRCTECGYEIERGDWFFRYGRCLSGYVHEFCYELSLDEVD